MLGNVEALRGRYFFLENGFDLVTGTLAFDAANPLDPMIDATLTTEKVHTVPGSSDAQGPSNVRETITLTVVGRATAPRVTLTSSSGLSQAAIVEILTYGQVRGQGGRALVAAGSQWVARQLVSEVPEIREVLGDFELGQRVSEGDATSASQSFTTVGVTRYFTRDLLVRYSQVVGDVSQTAAVDYQDLTAEYRLNRLLFLSGQVTRRRGVLVITAQDQTIYNLEVRARHEY
jgi:autotransporter translocation and assembly factor TamB